MLIRQTDQVCDSIITQHQGFSMSESSIEPCQMPGVELVMTLWFCITFSTAYNISCLKRV